MLTEAQFARYGSAEIMWYKTKQSLRLRYERKLSAYDEMLMATGSVVSDFENKVHTDIIADIAHLLASKGMECEFLNERSLLYKWSVDYTNECITMKQKPCSLDVSTMLKETFNYFPRFNTESNPE